MFRSFAFGLALASPLAILVIDPAAAAVSCTKPGVPVGCVARPAAGAPGVGAAPGAGAPGVGVAPGVGAPGVGVAPGPGPGRAGTGTARTNRGGPVNRVGRR